MTELDPSALLHNYPTHLPSPMKGVNWYNYPKAGAFWYARSKWNSRLFEERFRPDEFGGSVDSAMQAAMLWLIQTNQAIGKPTTQGSIVASMIRDNVGLTREMDNHTEYWAACIAEGDGAQTRTRFSIPKHGEHEAYRLAWNWRREQERRIFGVPLVGAPTVPSADLSPSPDIRTAARQATPPAGRRSRVPVEPSLGPRTTRVSTPATRLHLSEDELGWLPDEDFILSL